MLSSNELKKQLEGLIDKNSIESITISSPIKKSEAVTKIKVEAIMLKDKLCY